MQRLQEVLVKHEGYRRHPYRDSVGVLTVGIGRNLESKGLSRGEALLLLQNDMTEAYNAALREFPWFLGLTQNRKIVVLSMIFNLGLDGFRSFKRMIAAIEDENWTLASAEALDSTWRHQVGQRALDLAEMMEAG